jgi:AcrR family transcriptional regulator
MRNTPVQKRSISTVDDIAEAAIQLLNTTDDSKFTTIYVAERAGVSVGSLYRYFPDKGAILRHIVRREIKKMRIKALALINDSEASDPETIINEIVAHSTKILAAVVSSFFRYDHWLRMMMCSDRKSAKRRSRSSKTCTKRWSTLQEKLRGPMSKVALAATVDVFTTAVQTLARHSTDKFVDAGTKKRLLTSLLTALSEEESRSEHWAVLPSN